MGAGPAGAFAGARLARSGHLVTLYDASHPREKPCGGGVPAGAFRRYPELRELAALGRATRGIELWSPRRRLLRVELPEPIVVVSRQRLDSALVKRALDRGARLRAERVRRVRIDSQAAWVATSRGEERHDFVIGADGAASVVRRSLLGMRPGGAASCATAGFHVEGLPESDLVVEFLADSPGYLWVFPRPGHASVGVVCPVGHLGGAALRARVIEFLERRYPGSRELRRIPYAASIPCPTPAQAARAPLGGPHFALIGDAATQVDAITGEGIEHAFGSAATLAEAIDQEDPKRAARVYAERWRCAMGRELAIAARWAARWYRPRGVELLLALARRSPRARRLMSDLLMVVQPYSSLRRRMLREAWSGILSRGARSPRAPRGGAG